MSTINWPASLQPRDFRASIEYNQIAASSPLTKTTTVIDYLGERWRFGFTLPPIVNKAQAAYREALLLSLRGKSNKVNLWHMARPLPLGTMRGTPVLASTAAQGAQSLVLSGVRDTSRPNWIHYSDDIGSGWGRNEATIGGTLALAPDGTTTARKLVESAFNAPHYMFTILTLPAGTYVLSAYVKADGRTKVSLAKNGASSGGVAKGFDLSAGQISTQGTGYPDASTFGIEAAANGFYRCSMSFTSLGESIVIAAWIGDQIYAGNGTDGIRIWGVQLEPGTVPGPRIYSAGTSPTYAPGSLKAGDMLGVGGMLVMAAEDALADASGNMTVSLCNRLRKSVSSGSAVTWDKPTSTFILADGYGPVSYSPGIAESISLDFVESW